VLHGSCESLATPIPLGDATLAARERGLVDPT